MGILERNTVVFLNKDTERNYKHAYRVITPENNNLNLTYQLENLSTGESIYDIADTEFTLATEKEKAKLILNGDDYEEIEPAFDTEYVVGDNGYIIGVSAREDGFIVELNRDNTNPDTYYYYIEDNYYGINATLSIKEKDVNRVEWLLKDLLYCIGSAFPFETGLIKNIGKYFKPFGKYEFNVSDDIILNMLQFLESKGISYKNSTYDELIQAIDEYRNLRL